MSLVKKPVVTEEKLAANRRNQALTQGPATAAARERVGAAHLRHGLYAKAQEPALRGLGEDPAEFEELLEGLRQEFTPVGALQQELVIRLARALWLMDRTDRWQDGAALRRARSAESGRENRLHARMMRLKMTAESLRSLARSVAPWHYVTTREDLEVMKKLHQEGVTAEMGEIALGLFYQLQEPDTDEDGVSEEEKARGVVNSMRSVFGLGPIEHDVALLTPAGEQMVVRAEAPGEIEGPPEGEGGEEGDKDDRYPKITEEDWRARERARKLLKNILTRQAEICETERKALLKECVAGPSGFERAAEIAPAQSEALLARRVQDANFREVRRITNLLLKIKGRESKQEGTENLEAAATDVGGNLEVTADDPACHDVIQNKDT
jgi:hypothetical protein